MARDVVSDRLTVNVSEATGGAADQSNLQMQGQQTLGGFQFQASGQNSVVFGGSAANAW